MKQPEQKLKETPIIDNSGDNFVGNTDMRKNRSQAVKLLNVGKDIENQRRESGWIWMHNVKQSKQVHPDRVKQMENEGWRHSRSGCK